MMTSAQMRKILLDMAVLIVVSSLIISLGIWLSGKKAYDRRQEEYAALFSTVLAADHYDELTGYSLEDFSGISRVYLAYESDNSLEGYVIDVSVENQEGQVLHTLVGITSDGSNLTGIRRLDDTDNPVDLTDEEFTAIAYQMHNAQIPVALSSQSKEDDLMLTEYDTPFALTDGTYYAQALTADSNDYIDYVEMEVSDGRITKVVWDAFNIDATTEDRIEASLTGAYTVSGETWATQSYNICHALIEVQDPERLAMKSDGTTEIVEGVTSDISAFVNLSYECISCAEQGFDESEYVDALSELADSFGVSAADVTDDNGRIVYSFEDDEDSGTEVPDSVYSYVFENTDETDGDNADDTSEGTNTDTAVQSSDGSGEDLDGAEDGMAPEDTNSVISDSVDGLPLSEIRTYIDGISGAQINSSYVVTAVNTAYKFLKEYLNWIA